MGMLGVYKCSNCGTEVTIENQLQNIYFTPFSSTSEEKIYSVSGIESILSPTSNSWSYLNENSRELVHACNKGETVYGILKLNRIVREEREEDVLKLDIFRV